MLPKIFDEFILNKFEREGQSTVFNCTQFFSKLNKVIVYSQLPSHRIKGQETVMLYSLNILKCLVDLLSKEETLAGVVAGNRKSLS